MNHRRRHPLWLYAVLLVLALSGLSLYLASEHEKRIQTAPVFSSQPPPVVYEDTRRLSTLKVMDDVRKQERKSGSSRHGMALILDDMGYDTVALRRILALPYPVAISVLPGAPQARRIAEIAHRAGHVVMLHLPMEPENPWYRQRMDGAFLRADMDKETVRRVMLDDLARVPYAAGVNNHMGSRLTAMAAPMRWVMDICREKGLFFVDSRTSRDSVAAKLAREAGLTWGERRVFLDDSLKPNDLRASWKAAQRRALRNGFVIVIAHPHPETLDFLAHQVRREDVKRIVPLKALLMAGHAARFATNQPLHVQ